MNQLKKFLCILGAVCLTKGTLHKFSVAGRGKENFLVKEKQATSQQTWAIVLDEVLVLGKIGVF